MENEMQNLITLTEIHGSSLLFCGLGLRRCSSGGGRRWFYTRCRIFNLFVKYFMQL